MRKMIYFFLIFSAPYVFANNDRLIDLGQLEDVNGELRRPLIEYYDNAALRDQALTGLAVENLRTSENLLMSADRNKLGRTKIQVKKISVVDQLRSFEKSLTETK